VVTIGGRTGRLRLLLAALVLLVVVAAPVVASSGSGGSGPPGDAAATGAGWVPVPMPGEARPPPGMEWLRPSAQGLAQAAVDAAESVPAGSTDLGVAVLDRETGERAAGGQADEPFYTASLSKIVVAVDVLHRRRTEGLQVGSEDLELFRRALGPSDDAAMNVLWGRFDGVGAADRVSGMLDLEDTLPPEDPSQWGEMRISANDLLTIWRYVLEEMPAPDREFVVGAIGAAPDVARDGFDQAFGLLAAEVDGPGAVGAVAKQGWMCCFSGVYYLHSAGAVGEDERFVVALLSRIPREPGWEAARSEMTSIAAAAVRPLV
jgi:hypothetical protein